jgi:UDP-3-O-[3-hydroxymyristoyl] N-acetylglucosamine deacetylase
MTEVILRPTLGPQGVTLNDIAIEEYEVYSTDWSTQMRASPLHRPVSTLEHLFAALWMAGVDDVSIELKSLETDVNRDAPLEAPILDGSAWNWLSKLKPTPTPSDQRDLSSALGGGQAHRGVYRNPLVIKEVIEVHFDRCVARLSPPLDQAQFPLPLPIPLSIDLSFDLPPLEPMRIEVNHPEAFLSMIAPARTFGLAQWESELRNHGLIKGASMLNTLVYDQQGSPSSPLRVPSEPAAHKALDLIGDLFWLGRRVAGCLKVDRGSHALNREIIRQLKEI